MWVKYYRELSVNICILENSPTSSPPPKFFHGELTSMTILTNFFYGVDVKFTMLLDILVCTFRLLLGIL